MTPQDPFRAWTSISKSQLVGILDAVQNRILALALQLRKQHPELSPARWTETKENPRTQQLLAADVFRQLSLGAYDDQLDRA